ncbi:TolC family protein [Olivibacter sp. SDN3]|uniref:TolC family protein n=1 Tax=Olivibacter sp. SDN3 TaxID=2764720 RepID=UPI0021072068|nr:TolC family protein [Olivibacter sp. SDN3]
MMLNIKHFIYSTLKVIYTILLLPMALHAQQSNEVLSLDTILQRIDQQNVKLKVYALKGKSFEYSAQSATSWMAPMVGAGTFMTPYPGQRVMNDGDKGALMFNIEQEIPNPSKQQANKQYIQSQSVIEEANRAVDLNELKAQAKTLYYNWTIAEKRINLLKENEQLINSMKQLETIRYEYNQSQLSNVYKLEAQLEENHNMLRMQEAEIARSRAWLNSLMNQSANNSFAIDTAFKPTFILEASLDTTVLAERRKDIQKMNADIQTMRHGIDAMRSERKPDFKIRFDHMAPLGNMMPRAYSIMGMVSIPIAPWSSKMYKSETKAMQLNLEAMQKERQGMLLESQGMIYGMQHEIASMKERIRRIEQKVIPALQRSMEANFQSYRENKQQLPTLLADWEALNMMQNTLFDEKLKFYQMIVNYEKELYK